jgi:hypothetical protein
MCPLESCLSGDECGFGTNTNDLVSRSHGIYPLSTIRNCLIISWLVGWSIILPVILGPILIIIYVRVSVIKERELGGSEDYKTYRKEVPFFL